ncbi:MAG TPA: 30S ribosomal protein S1 [Chloroflexota bacterium]|nr:30S ribosomal protein S1 [Chloroflexota bacterium]
MDTEHRGSDATHQQEVGAQAPAAESQPDTEQSMEALLRENESAFRRLHRGETVEGTIVRVSPDEILVDVGLKSEGVIPAREMFPEGEGEPELHVGDRTLVVVVHPEGAEGHAILSLRRARIERAWREIEELYQQGAVIEAPVVEHNKGGLIVDVKGVRGFVPVSQVLDLRNVARTDGENQDVSDALAAMAGRRLPLKVIEINRSRNRLILSERAAVQERRTQRKDELMEQLQPGQVRQGVVSNITSFGAFVDLGGADGLVHVSELSYNRVNHPSEVVQVGQQVSVAVLSVDREGKKIALSLKRALPDPWDTVEQNYHIGQVVNATITKLAKFGAFAKVEEGLEGLIHTSELTDRPITEPGQVVQEGQVLPVKIIQVNSQRRRLGLSARQAQQPYGYGSYGDFETSSPFATSDLAAYHEETPMSSENGYEIAPTEQAEPAADVEPEARTTVEPVDTSEETPPSPDIESGQEENQTAAAIQGSASE